MSTDLAELIVRARAAVAEAHATRETSRDVCARAAALSGGFIALLRRTAWLAHRSEVARGDGPDGSSTVAELALRQNVMRGVNERIDRLRWAQSDGEQIGYVCECSLVDCTETVAMNADAYEALRASPLRFVLRPGHECSEVERVVERQLGYTVVENVGEAAEIARGFALSATG